MKLLCRLFRQDPDCREFTDYMAVCCPDKHLELVIETNYV